MLDMLKTKQTLASEPVGGMAEGKRDPKLGEDAFRQVWRS